MIRLDIGKGYVALLSDEDARLAEYVWRPMEKRRDGAVVQVYVQRSIKFANGKWGASLLHREVMSAPAGMEVDHVDRNGLNCTRENLRLATVAENRRHSLARRNTATGMKGVTKGKNGRFVAQIRASGKRGGRSRWLGSFASIDDAARAYDRAARVLHGDFAELNFPNQPSLDHVTEESRRVRPNRRDGGKLDWPTTRRVAVLSGSDPRTVDRVMLGIPTRPSVRARIQAVLLERGLMPPERADDAAAHVEAERRQVDAVRALARA